MPSRGPRIKWIANSISRNTTMPQLETKQTRTGWSFLSLSLIHLGAFAIYPIVFAFFISLYHWNILDGQRRFVGFTNYLFSLREPTFLNALWNSCLFTVLSVPLGLAAGLLAAILVAQPLRGITAFRVIYYIPAISSGVATSIMWIYIYLPENGLINTVFGWLHIQNKTDFLHDARFAMLSLVGMSVITGLGPRMILYLSGLISIPPSLYEAASIDGATGWRAFRSITLPMLTPTTLFVIVTSTIGAMQLFTPVYMMTQGGPEGKTDVIGYHIYTDAWQNFATGLASAKSFILLAVILLMSIVQFKLVKSGMEGYGA